jgi:hypothetical protein
MTRQRGQYWDGGEWKLMGLGPTLQRASPPGWWQRVHQTQWIFKDKDNEHEDGVWEAATIYRCHQGGSTLAQSGSTTPKF